MVTVYLVRHGQTGGNYAKRHQHEGSHLTEEGKLQAAALAAAIARLSPTHLFVSTRVRAIETGQAIAQATDLVPETNELFSELCRPWRIYGNYHKSLTSLWYMAGWFLGRVGGNDCGERGESYRQFIVRIMQARHLLESLPDDTVVVVVSHSVFINFFLAHMNRPIPLPWYRAPLVFKNVLGLKNGSLTTLLYNVSQMPAWSLTSCNQSPD